MRERETDADTHFGISKRSYDVIVAALQRRAEIERALVFGSRAKGTGRHGSDIDIAITGAKVTEATARELSVELNERLPIPYYVDVVAYGAVDDQELREHIDRVGRVFYNPA